MSNDHPRTYSLVGSPHLFLVTDDESRMTIGYADKIGGPLVAPPLDALDVGLLAQTGVNVWGWDISRARQYAQTFAAEYARLAALRVPA